MKKGKVIRGKYFNKFCFIVYFIHTHSSVDLLLEIKHIKHVNTLVNRKYSFWILLGSFWLSSFELRIIYVCPNYMFTYFYPM